MQVSHFIAKHLSQKSDSTQIKGGSVCALCGLRITDGFRKKDIFSGNFSDWQQLKYKSEYLCKHCAACLSGDGCNGSPLRFGSYIVTSKGLVKADKVELLKFILSNRQKPFTVLVTYNYKKHHFFNAAVNNDCANFVIGTDEGSVFIKRDEFKTYHTIASRLHKAGFSKTDIDNCESQKVNKIAAYGINKFISDMDEIKRIKNTKLLNLILFLV